MSLRISRRHIFHVTSNLNDMVMEFPFREFKKCFLHLFHIINNAPFKKNSRHCIVFKDSLNKNATIFV
jgi:hypothetical protein